MKFETKCLEYNEVNTHHEEDKIWICIVSINKRDSKDERIIHEFGIF
jgi:hypothetical protein